MANSNASEFILSVKKSLISEFIGSINDNQYKIQRLTRQTVIDFQAYETGKLANNTTAKFKINESSKNPVIITFLTYDTYNKKGKNYSIYPFYGLSTSTKYGLRNWLEESAGHTLQLLDIGYYTSTLKRGGGKGLR